MAKKQETRKKSSFWRSQEARRFYWVFGIPVFLLLSWYSYNVAFEFNRPAMSQFEKDVKVTVTNLAERALREGFATEQVNHCRRMAEAYTTPKGWHYSDAKLYQLVGLSPDATVEQMNERCIYFAKAVAQMQKMSHRIRHAFVCGDSILDIGNKGRFYFKADPQGRGVLRRFDPRQGERLVAIPKGESTVVLHWQIYNVGDGCVIAGLSKVGVFRMAGKVDYAN